MWVVEVFLLVRGRQAKVAGDGLEEIQRGDTMCAF